MEGSFVAGSSRSASSLVNYGSCLGLTGFGFLGCSVSVFGASRLGLSISAGSEALLGGSLSDRQSILTRLGLFNWHSDCSPSPCGSLD